MSQQTADQRGVEAVLATVQERAVILTPNYNTYEYFLYYLLAEGWEERDVYVAFFGGNIDTTKAYLREGTPYDLANTKNPPAGLQVYCYLCGDAAQLRSLGFGVETAAGGLSRLRLP